MGQAQTSSVTTLASHAGSGLADLHHPGLVPHDTLLGVMWHWFIWDAKLLRNMLKRIVFTIYHLPKTMESIEDHLLKLRLNRRYVKPSTNTLGQFVIVCYGKWLVYS
jgi:hypothetical protein